MPLPSDDARDDVAHSYAPLNITCGWQCVSTPAGACATPDSLDAYANWIDAPVPGTIASAHQSHGVNVEALAQPFALADHWYRVSLKAKGKRRLRFNGLATITELWLDGHKLLDSDSMFIAHDIDVDLEGEATLFLCFRSIAPALAAKRGRARWRPKLAQPATLRNVRTTLLGHMPGWCPAIQPAGPWREVELIGESLKSIERIEMMPRVENGDGVLDFTVRFYHAQEPIAPRLECGNAAIELAWQDAHTASGQIRIAQARLWWPHTHGEPSLYDVRLDSESLGKIGFRSIDVDRGADVGFQLVLNGVPVFARGACWTSADIVSLAASREKLDAIFRLCRDAGINMIRVSGITLYESNLFYELADRYGVMIWQDFAFANFDYPTDEAFKRSVQSEAKQFLARTRRFASLAVLCGGSEVHQQAAMLGLPYDAYQQRLFAEQLPAIIKEHRPDVPYVVNSPSAAQGDTVSMPFGTRGGITHYYGVGAYQRPLDDARRAQVRFASECLAFANVPDDVALRSVPNASRAHEPRWKSGVARDPGSAWDFDDVREHYLRAHYGVDVARLRYEDPERYLELSRAVVPEVIGAVFSEWRRAGSTCAGGIVWNLLDLRVGAGWGVIDVLGAPKSALHGMARVLQPVQVLITDEGLDGLDIHLVNETPHDIQARVELACLCDGSVKVAGGSSDIVLAARSVQRLTSSSLIGAFFDIAYAYRFGPRSHDATHVKLLDVSNGDVLSEAFHFPDPTIGERRDIGLRASLEKDESGWSLLIETAKLARWVHVNDPNYRARIDWFHLAPGHVRRIPLVTRHADVHVEPEGDVVAINASKAATYRA